jgi:23S rRNA (cytosine1962-C5)-methyltransferase
MKVLDLFSNEGGFAINLAKAGAVSVIAVDSSVPALKRLKANAAANGVAEKITTVARDCFEFIQEQPEQFDMLVVDPPALVKSKRDLPQAVRSYQSLNQHALRLAAPGGIVFTASCSHHMTRDFMEEVIRESARKSRRTVTLLEERGAGIDHPVLIGMPETAYLHGFVLRVL